MSARRRAISSSSGSASSIGAEEFDERVEPLLRNGRYREALADLASLRAAGNLTPAAEISADVAEVNCLLFLKGPAAVEEILAATGRRLEEHPEEFGEEAERLRVAVLSVGGLSALTKRDPKAARPLLEAADAGYQALNLPSQQSGVVMNLSLAALMSSEFNRCAELLDRSELLSSKAELSPEQRRERSIAMAINRSSVHSVLGEARQAVEELQAIRPLAVELESWHRLASLDLNLSTFYFQMEMFGSSLEAARSAIQTYQRVGIVSDALQAEAMEAKALAKLGRTEEAEAKLDILLQQADDAAGEAVWLEDTAVGLGIVYRATGRSSEADVLDARLAFLRQGVREVELATLLFDEIIGLVNGWIEGENVADRLPASTHSAIEELRASESPLGAAVAELAERFFSALVEGASVAPLAEANATVLKQAGLDPDQLRDVIDGGLAVRARDDHRLLHSSLTELVRHQLVASSQEAAEYRQQLLAGRGGSDLLTALLVCLRKNRFDILFELIEWCRRDLSELTKSEDEMVLKPFSSLSGGATITALDQASALSVKRGSALRSANPAVKVVAEADDIRDALGGRHAAWLTMMRFEEHVYWSLLTSGSVHGGRVPVENLEPALAAHRISLPVPLEMDRAAAGDHAEPWCLQTVAMARAASAGLLADLDLFEACIRALPQAVANRILTGERPGAGDVMNAYKALGRQLVPDALERYLDATGPRARLIVSVQPELANIPFGLLGTRNGQILLERATIGFAPPTRTAAEIAARDEATGPCGSSLSVINPSDDLVDLSGFSGGDLELRGWGGSRDPRGVASAEACAASLRRLREEGRGPSRMGFLGHIRPGAASDPGSAALVLSSAVPGGSPEHLSAMDIIAAGIPAPARIYLGGCEGVGFDTGLEWASVSAALLVQGASTVLAHGWPVVEDGRAAKVDRSCVEAMDRTADVAGALRDLQVEWFHGWRRREPEAISPYYWAGLHAIGRSRPERQLRYPSPAG